MQSIWISLALLGGLGAVFGLLLAFAAKKFAVESDPRIDEIEQVMPGANCGACGYPGCRGAAEAIVEGKAPTTACPVGKAAVADKIAAIMGTSAGASEAKRAILMCRGGREECPDRFVYVGVADCAAAHRLAGGPKGCEFGCLGLGSCVVKCPFGAIHINEKGLAEIGPDCTGCGLCVSACPRGLLMLVPADKPVVVNRCKNTQRGPEVRKICKVGCIACSLCVRNCPKKAIAVVNNVAVIDQDKCAKCNLCMSRCPVQKPKPEPKRDAAGEQKKETQPTTQTTSVG
ncbi:MAG: RnfABCDGE type electron transport complex subunit B [Bacteroidota bacterium]